ncbi:MAG TPA: hypothetical protein PLF86_01205 [Candidatus Moranbacteria bacterium]|nr:hypothetical protein [Candidatus Moranbacteria bacterium]
MNFFVTRKITEIVTVCKTHRLLILTFIEIWSIIKGWIIYKKINGFTKPKGRDNMKKIVEVAGFLLLLVLVSCGGGSSHDDGGGNTKVFPSVNITQDELDNAVAKLEVFSDHGVFYPAMVGEYIVHLSDGEQECYADKNEIAEIYWNDEFGGFHAVDPEKGLKLEWDPENPVLEIPGEIASSGATISFVLNDGRELSIITDEKWLVFECEEGMFAKVTENGLICIGYDDGIAPPQTLPELTKIEINTVTGTIQITPGFQNGKIFYLVDSNPVETVCDSDGNITSEYEVAWNDVYSWYPTRGILADLALPQTLILNAANAAGCGEGMPYLVRPDRSYVSFNTEKCIVFVDGVDVTATAIGSDGLIHY